MLTDNRVFIKIKSKSYLSLCKHWHSQKAFTSFVNLVYFDRRDQFNPSMGSSDTWSDNYGQTT